MDAPSIMIVDDTPANLHLLAELLQGNGYRVRPFPRAELALKAARRECPDLALLDIDMPDMNGYELCRRLKALPELAEVPVLFLSAMTETGHKLEAFEAGGVDFIEKPFRFEEVRARVETHLALRSTRRALEDRNRELALTIERLEASERQREKLTGMIVHDLRNPLSVIKGSIELLRQVIEVEGFAERSINRADAACDRALEILQTLQDIHKMRMRGLTLKRARGRLRELIAAAVEVSLPSESEGRVDILADPAAELSFDAALMSRVLQNILSNAWDFTPADGRLAITLEQREAEQRIEVHDDGPGIPEDERERVFELFYQGENRASKGHGGMGLAFCKLAVEAHGGDIGVEASSRRGGSCFWFSLPA